MHLDFLKALEEIARLGASLGPFVAIQPAQHPRSFDHTEWGVMGLYIPVALLKAHNDKLYVRYQEGGAPKACDFCNEHVIHREKELDDPLS